MTETPRFAMHQANMFLTIQRVLAVLLLGAGAIVLTQLVADLNREQRLKSDLAELHHVRYGLLNADVWVAELSKILTKRINDFEVDDGNRAELIQAIEQVLGRVLDELEQYLRERNLTNGDTWQQQLRGILRQGVQDLLIDFEQLRRQVPEYAARVVEQLTTPEAKQEIRQQLLAWLNSVAEQTFAQVDRGRLALLLARYGCSAPDTCAAQITRQVAQLRTPIRTRLGIFCALLLATLLLCPPRRRVGPLWLDPFALAVWCAVALALLIGGILTPMIELDARIGELRLRVLGEPLVFANQVLYHQSKSIVEVVTALLRADGPQMWLVAVLVALFSIGFPLLKFVATLLYYANVGALRQQPIVRFFALKSAKWSMADVFVVAIFMAYIALDALVGSQLSELAHSGRGDEVLTTNATTLAPGFYLFLGFVLISLVLSSWLEREDKS